MPKPKPIHLGDVVLRVVRGPNDQGIYYWRAIQRVDGKEKTIHSGWGTPLELAEQVKVKLSGEVQLATPLPIPVEAPSTIGELLETWLAWKLSDPKIGKVSRDRYTRSVASVLVDIRTLPLNAPSALLDWRNDILGRVGDHTYNSYHQVIQSAWLYGSDHGWVTGRLPIKKQPRPAYVNEHYTPTEHEVELLFKNLEGEPWEILSLYICKHTGCRVGEVANLTWSHIDFLNHRITLEGKTGRRTIPLHQHLEQLLFAWRDLAPNASENIFNKSKHSILRYIAEPLQRAANRAGIQHSLTIHSLRRYKVNELRRAGVDIATAAEWMGHQPATMLKVYTAVTEEDLLNALALLS